MNKQRNFNKFVVLCYHYLRLPKEQDPFPRILGNTIGDFIKHIKTLRKKFAFMAPDDVEKFYQGKFITKSKKIPLLLTFDDGLSDHYLAAKILKDFNIKAFFFIPTCILTDKLPANPNIVHYCLAKYGITRFLETFKKGTIKLKIRVKLPAYEKGFDPWKTIARIKTVIRNMKPVDSRKVLVYIYKNLLYRDYKNALEIIHLTPDQIRDMLTMGHSIGSHTHSHVSVASSKLSKNQLKKELELPQKIFHQAYGIKVTAMAYPFGEARDCLKAKQLLKITKNYQLAFTIEGKVNNLKTSPLELGRYEVNSKDTPAIICKKLLGISNNLHL